MLSAFPAAAECYFVSLREFHVSEGADPFAMGDFVPMIALEAGRFFPLAPERMAEAPHATRMEGRQYYIPRYLIDDKERFSLRMMMLDHDKDTRDDLVLPLSEGLIDLNAGKYEAGFRLQDVRFMPFSDTVPAQSNVQRFTFEIEKRQGHCNLHTQAGRAQDRQLRRENELRRLWAQVQTYEHFGANGQEYLPYRVSMVDAARLPAALDGVFDMASVNARELIELGYRLRALGDVAGFNRGWVEYIRLVRRLLAQQIPMRYWDEKGVRKQSSAPSLAFHPDWKRLGESRELPVLPGSWGIALPE